MTVSDVRRNAAGALGAALRELQQAAAPNRVAERTDALLMEFLDRGSPAYTHAAMHEAIRAFVQRAYAEALPARQELTSAQASAEAVALLERGYPASGNSGYDAAVVDAAVADCGVEFVLTRLAEILKAEVRTRWMDQVLTRRLTLLPWDQRCEVARLLLDRCCAHLPSAYRRLSPAQVVDEIPALVHLVLEPDHLLRSVTGVAPPR